MNDDIGRPSGPDWRTPIWFAVTVTIAIALVTILFDLLGVGHVMDIALMSVGVGFILLGGYMGLIRHKWRGAMGGFAFGLGFIVGPTVGHIMLNLFRSLG